MARTIFAPCALCFALACGGERPADARHLDAGGDGGRDGSVDARVDAPMPPRCSYSCLWTCPVEACDDPVESERMRARDGDGDGLSDYDELCVYETDPCQPDTTRDGCFDLAEHVLREGCTDEDRGVFLHWNCGGSDVRGTLELTVSGARDEVHLLVVDREGYAPALSASLLPVRALGSRTADGNEGGATVSDDHFREVVDGARVVFEIRLDVTMFWEGESPHVGTLRLVDGEGATLEERLLIVALPYCPVLI